MAQLRVGTASRGPEFDVSITSVIPAPRDPTPLASWALLMFTHTQTHTHTPKDESRSFKESPDSHAVRVTSTEQPAQIPENNKKPEEKVPQPKPGLLLSQSMAFLN